jgi:prepilin-type N-terminal cleavage/methylation domain-containing protein
MRQGQSTLINQRAFTLLEVIVAIFVVSVGVGGVFAFLQNTVLLGPSLDNQLIASYLAQEGVEIVRNIRDTNYIRIVAGEGGSWDEGLANCSGGCEGDYTDFILNPLGGTPELLQVVSSGVGTTRYQYYAYELGTLTIFQRVITIDGSISDLLQIAVEVRWQEKGVPRSYTIDTELYNWVGF